MQVQNLDESRKDYYKGNVMPFNVNNVDVTVAANGIYGITNGVLSGLLPSSMLEDLDIQVGYLKNDYGTCTINKNTHMLLYNFKLR